MKKLLLATYCLILSHHLIARADDTTAIRKMLTTQVQEWNKGSIDGYMHGYWQSDSLLFIGSKGPRYGYATTLAGYKQAYPDAAHMGKLTSRITSMQRLSADYYFIIGTWGWIVLPVM